MSDTVSVLNGRGETVLTYKPPPLDWAPVSFSEGGVQYRRNDRGDGHGTGRCPPDSAIDAWERSLERTARQLQQMTSAPPPYLSHVQTGSCRPVPQSRDRGRSALDVVRDVASAIAPLFVFLGRCAAGAWACLVALAADVRDRYRAWVDAPRQADGARRVELLRLRRDAAEQAAFADANGMPESAAVWRQIAAQERGEVS